MPEDPVTHRSPAAPGDGEGGTGEGGAGRQEGREGAGEQGAARPRARAPRSTAKQRADMAAAGHRKDVAAARRGLTAGDARLRELALGALARAGALDEAAVLSGLRDAVPAVRRRAADLASRLDSTEALARSLRAALADPDPLVVEAACWSLGELAATGAVATLSGIARLHVDARAREAALAALAAIGDPAGLEAVLDALGDRPTVRRRAVVALAAFDGPEVDEALRRSAADRDWQVREVAEILLEETAEDP